MNRKPYFLTTAIAYTSAKPHIGNTYEIILSDALARFKRAQGYDVFFQTGTDEHGQKIEEKAAQAHVSPKQFVDNISSLIQDNWDLMNTSYDYFIRTTDESHEEAVQKIFRRLYEQGDIYKGEYEGWYCTPCESFWTESQLVDGKCPDCGRPVHKAKEEAYFFNMSKYADRLMKYIEENPDFIQPESRKNEMINNFLKPGLQDLCVSRTSFKWGIPVDFDDRHVIYVWLDALTNYITSLGYDATLPYEEQSEAFKRYWPATHIIGKDILRFHTIYWPIFLMALDLPLPKKVFGHPWMLVGEGKMSKSKGNVIYAEDLVDRFGVDAVRYYCLHEMPYAQDGVITWELVAERINSDLANILGNLVSRTIAMENKYFDGKIENPQVEEPIDQELQEIALEAIKKTEEKMEAFQVGAALDEIFTLLRRSNKYIDETEPWKLAKDPKKQARLQTVLYNLLESIRIAAVLLESFMPETSQKILDALNTKQRSFDSIKSFGHLETDISCVSSIAPLFQRIDLKEFEESTQEIIKPEKKNKKEKKKKKVDPISIDDFGKVSLKAGKILDAKVHPDANKLIIETIDLGEETPRQIVSGIAQNYAPEDLIGKTVLVVSNLNVATIRGVESQGMILCSLDKKGPKVIFLDETVLPGTVIR